MTTLVVAPSRPKDDALRCTRWMADALASRLRASAHTVMEVCDEHAHREKLEDALTDAQTPIEGVAFFTHGSVWDRREPTLDDALWGVDEKPAFDRENAAMLAKRWAHALACRSGVELAGIAVHHGAACFVGYDVAIHVDWDPNDLGTLTNAFANCFIHAAFELATGCRDGLVMRKGLNTLLEALEEQSEQIPEEVFNAAMLTAQQLLGRMVFALPALTTA